MLELIDAPAVPMLQNIILNEGIDLMNHELAVQNAMMVLRTINPQAIKQIEPQLVHKYLLQVDGEGFVAITFLNLVKGSFAENEKPEQSFKADYPGFKLR